MSRTFLYARVSTAEQSTENQILEIKSAGFNVEPHRIIQEVVSGSVATKKRVGFVKLLERMERGDVLLVSKLDRLGRNAIDVRDTVESLERSGVKVYCLALGGVDLTSSSGKMTMQILNAVAEFERDLLIERTSSGLARARASGKKLGRPPANETNDKVKQLKQQGLTQSRVVEILGISIATVKRHWNK